MSNRPARRLALELRRRGLSVPARLLVDAHRPIAPLLSDLGAAAGPVLRAVVGGRHEGALGDPGFLDALLAEIDATEDRP